MDVQPGDGWRVTLTDGRVSSQDLVIAAIGLTPNLALACGAGLAVERGILVDDRLQTSALISSHWGLRAVAGSAVPLPATHSAGGQCVGAHLLGTPTPLTLPPCW